MGPLRPFMLTLLTLAGLAIAAYGALLGVGRVPSMSVLHPLWPITSAMLVALQALAFRKPRLDAGVRRGWLLFLIATSFSFAADIAWITLGDDSRLSAVLSLVDSTLCASAILAFPGAIPERGRRGRTVLDLLIVFGAGAVAMWDTMLRPVLIDTELRGFDFVVTASSPITDFMLLVGAAALLLRRHDAPTSRALVLVAASFLVNVVVDAAWAVQSMQNTYVEGGWIDWGWFLARWIWAAAVYQQVRGVEGVAMHPLVERGLRSVAALVPLVAMGVGFFFIIRIVAEETVGRGLWGTGLGAVALCVLVLVRQTFNAVTQERLNVRLEVEKDKSERLLLNILPAPIARRLTDDTRTEPIADSYHEATVLFADLVGFTALAAQNSPERLVTLLDAVFSAFDQIADRYGLEKIKTIGDAYMAAAGVPEPRADHVEAAARMALEMRDVLPRVAEAHGVALQIRIGLHTGPVVAGVIGYRKFIYDLWGDTVNTASRMESHGAPGAVHVSAAVAARLPPAFQLTPCGERDIKGKGLMETYLLAGTFDR